MEVHSCPEKSEKEEQKKCVERVNLAKQGLLPLPHSVLHRGMLVLSIARKAGELFGDRRLL